MIRLDNFTWIFFNVDYCKRHPLCIELLTIIMANQYKHHPTPSQCKRSDSLKITNLENMPHVEECPIQTLSGFVSLSSSMNTGLFPCLEDALLSFNVSVEGVNCSLYHYVLKTFRALTICNKNPLLNTTKYELSSLFCLGWVIDLILGL